MWTGILIGLVLFVAVLLLVCVCAPNLVPARMRWSANGADDDEADDDANDDDEVDEVDEVDDHDNGDADNGADDNADDELGEVNIDDNMLPTSTRQGAASFANPMQSEVKLLTSRPEMDQVSDRVFNKSRFGATPSLLTLIHGKGGRTEDDVERTNGVVPGSAS